MKPFFDMSLLIAFGFLSLLLLLGVLLRAKIKFLQNFMVPACLTGGVIGFFILNTTGFPQVQPELYPALAYHFFTISFVCIGLRGMSKVDQSKGSATKEMVRGSIWQAQMFHMGLCSQLILATGIVYLLNALTGRDYLESIGFLAAQGFAAGPGQAISTGLVWEKFGHSGMGQLGMTFAGVGFIVAFAIGVPLVRWGVRKGLNTYPVGSVPEEVKTGLLAPENRPCGLRQVTQNSNVDSLALQLALVLGAWMLAYYAVEAVATRVPSSIGGTMWGLFFLINMVSGMLIRFAMRKLGIVHLIDGDSMTRLTGWMMEFLLLSTLIGIKFAVGKGLHPPHHRPFRGPRRLHPVLHPVLRTPRPRLFLRADGHDVRDLHGDHPHRAHPAAHGGQRAEDHGFRGGGHVEHGRVHLLLRQFHFPRLRRLRLGDARHARALCADVPRQLHHPEGVQADRA